MDAFITAIFNAGGSAVTGLLSVLVSLFTGLIDIFWIAGVDGTGGQLTILGSILIVGATSPLVIWGLNWIVRFFRNMIRR